MAFEEVRKSSPSHIVGKYPLFVRICEAVFIFEFMEKLYRHNVVTEPFERSSDADIVIFYPEICPVFALYLGIEDMGRQIPLFARFWRSGKGFSL